MRGRGAGGGGGLGRGEGGPMVWSGEAGGLVGCVGCGFGGRCGKEWVGLAWLSGRRVWLVTDTIVVFQFYHILNGMVPAKGFSAFGKMTLALRIRRMPENLWCEQPMPKVWIHAAS